ncbi:MAG: HAD-IB family hydrolase [Flavobacteriales bacterium]|nr:HAD-IB family hydrolase [Flavobacteriales bacterium]
MRRLYLFDFDGTLTKKDTLFDFLKTTQPNYYLGFALFIPLFVLAKLNILDPARVKERFIAFFLKGKSERELQELGNQYLSKSGNLFHEKAKEYIESIKDFEDKYIVSASLDIWVRPFANYYNFKLICTKAKMENGRYTGRYDGKNCNHTEKPRRVKQEINLEQFQEIYAFGDTKGDQGLLDLATHPHFQYFGKGI